MAKNTVIGLVSTQAEAEQVVAGLRSAGFGTNDISALFPDKSGTRDFAYEQNTKSRAKKVLQDKGATDVVATGESGVPSKKRLDD